LKAAIDAKFPEARVKLIESGNGVFEVMKEQNLIFSKKQLGRFPEHPEILDQI
jgi:selT/selW/selH-like putative selenoprotein